MRSRALLACLVLAALPARAQNFATSSLMAPASQADLQAILDTQSAQTVKQPSVPATGPGAGLCRQTIVPSDLVTSGGVTGTAGTCSRVLQCGTSAQYVVTQFNVGSGC